MNDFYEAVSRAGRPAVLVLSTALLLCACAEPATGPPQGFPDPPPEIALSAPPYQPRPAGTLTFNRDIAPIVFADCSICHRPGEAAPFPFLTYDDVRKRGKQIVTVISSGYMPPWLPVEGYNEFLDTRGLTADEIGTIRQWVGEGMPEGDPADLPALPAWPTGWQLGEPDLVLRFTEPFTLVDAGEDVFRNFVIPSYLPVDRYVAAIEFRPDNAPAVHHAEFRIDTTQRSRRIDEADPGPGFDGMFFEDVGFPDGHFLGWAPGGGPTESAVGQNWTLRRDADLVMQLHLQSTGRTETVHPRLGLFFSDEPPVEIPMMIQLRSHSIDIPPGESMYPIQDSYVLPVDVHVLSVFPHAHYLGQDMQAWTVLPDGTRRWLLRIDDWDFNWQDRYRYAEPVFLPAGSTLAMRYTYDNSEENVRNPSYPPQRVVYGPRSKDEMGDLWIQLLPSAADRAALDDDYQRFDRDRTVAEFEGLIEQTGGTSFNHNILAQEFIEAGRLDEAAEHLQASLAIDPDAVLTRNNLAMVRIRQGDAAGAEEQLRTALQLDPDAFEARLNLAQLLESTGRRDEALGDYEQAVATRDDNPNGHFFFGRALQRVGNASGALEQYRRAMELEPQWVRPLDASAWLRATHPTAPIRDPQLAVSLAELAAEISRRQDPGVLETLAAAYASAGRFDDAVGVLQAALDLTDDPALSARLEQGLALYGSGQAPSSANP